MDILRFITAGSVDDGKSTLIGRLLYDSKSILTDQLEAIEKSSKNRNNGEIDLALLTDGLRAEREQGITIDVAYRYFSTLNRKFIIADAPGHVQYTRNMVTGASNSDLVVILIDARKGVIEQTRRHSIIASLLGISKVFVTINKIDLVSYSEERYNEIVSEYEEVAKNLDIKDIQYFPVSALNGDNIVDSSLFTPWYTGPTLLEALETVDVEPDVEHEESRFQVQLVIRPQTPELHDYRGYAGRISSGKYKKGDQVRIFPSGIETVIDRIEFAGKEIPEALAGESITILLKDEIDISRGDSIFHSQDVVNETTEPEALICWLDEKPLQIGNKYLLQQGQRRVRAVVKEINFKLDVNTLQPSEVSEVRLNEVVKTKLKLQSPIAVDAYKTNKGNGSAILIDETSHKTVAAVLFQ